MQRCERIEKEQIQEGRWIAIPSISGAGVPRWKRIFDLFFVGVTAPVWLPLAALIAIGIKLYSRGPVLFKQERVGYKGARFVCFKFRSMKVGADQTLHRDHLQKLIQSESPMTKLDERGDSRVFGLGKLLRATGLDELPQLLNIVRGEMSLVGPRPCLPYEYEEYPKWARKRFETLPGLTGYWQVYGKNRTTFTQMLRMDVWYAENKSLGLDLLIVIRTPWVLVRQVFESVLGNRKRRGVVVQKVTP